MFDHRRLSLHSYCIGIVLIFCLSWGLPIVSLAGTLDIQESSALSVTLTWTAPGDDGDQGAAAVYDIRYSTQPITEANWDLAVQTVGEPTPQVAGTIQQMIVGGLSENTTYCFAMKTADEVPNWSGLSNALVVDHQAPNALYDVEAGMGVNFGDLELSWTATGDDGADGTAGGYLILYDTDSITLANWASASLWSTPPPPLPSGQSQTFTLTGLTPGTEYYVAIIVVDDVGNESVLSNVAKGVAKFSIIVDVDEEDEDNSVPYEYTLSQNFPNPFNPSTTIMYSLKSADHVTISVFNILGQWTSTLVDCDQPSGIHTVSWDGTDANGRPVPSGIFLYRIQAGSYNETKKMVLMR